MDKVEILKMSTYDMSLHCEENEANIPELIEMCQTDPRFHSFKRGGAKCIIAVQANLSVYFFAVARADSRNSGFLTEEQQTHMLNLLNNTNQRYAETAFNFLLGTDYE